MLDAAQLIITPLLYVNDPAKRLFWMHILGSVVLAAWYFRAESPDLGPAALARRLLCKKYWWNASTRIDYALLFFNAVLKLVVFIPILGGQLGIALITARVLHLHVLDAPQISAGPIFVSLSFTLVAFVFDDATRFLTHLAMHRNPFLWRIHRLHHSATTLTPFTVFRTHPLESFINYLRSIVALGLISGVFIWGFGAQLQVWDILGVNALGFLLTLAGSNLRHSHIPLEFGSFERFIISPAQHQLHHSIDHGHGNLGAYLALWDRWNKSFIWGSSADNLTFGLSDYEEKASPNRGMPVGDFPH